jgi:hypothetical protein
MFSHSSNVLFYYYHHYPHITFSKGTVVVVIVQFCKELNAPATTGDKSDGSMGNFMRN